MCLRQAAIELDSFIDQFELTLQIHLYHRQTIILELEYDLRPFYVQKCQAFPQFYCCITSDRLYLAAIISISSTIANLLGKTSKAQRLKQLSVLFFYYQYIKMEINLQKYANRANCQQHSFSIKPSKQNPSGSLIFSANFCKQKCFISDEQSEPIFECCSLNYPAFNKDNNFRTPAFVSKEQNNAQHSSNGNNHKLQHEDYLDYSRHEKSEMNIPKPRSRNSYCSVCRKRFRDYLSHIGKSEHKLKIKTSMSNPHIEELANKYNKRKRVLNLPLNISKTQNSSITEITDSLQIIEKPKSKINRKKQSFALQQKNSIEQRNFREQVPMDYAKYLVDTFRGINKEQANNNYYNFDPWGFRMAGLFPFTFNLPQNKAIKPIVRQKIHNKVTFIIIDQ